MSKKILCVFISIVMMLAIAPFTVFASDSGYKQGDIIEFGSYPQSQVTDESVINELNGLELEWKSIKQYINWNQIAEVYKYADVEYNNEKYRALYSVETNETSWYIYEPIEWVVIDPETGYVLCNVALEAKSFQLDESKHYADADWETSDIRRWLNEEFYQAAFSASQTKSIITTNTDMKIYNEDGEITGYNTVSDNIVLFSLEDALNEQYGFVQLNGNREFNSYYYVVTGDLGRYSSDYAYYLGANGFEEIENADWAEKYKGCMWLLRKNTESAYRPAYVYPKSPAAYYIEDGVPFHYGYYDEETNSHVYAYGDASGYVCLVDSYDLVNSRDIYSICPAMHINFETFDKEQIPGDLDGNGTVTPSDARTALRIAANLETATDDMRAVADINSDGHVTPSDARTILRIAANLE